MTIPNSNLEGNSSESTDPQDIQSDEIQDLFDDMISDLSGESTEEGSEDDGESTDDTSTETDEENEDDSEETEATKVSEKTGERESGSEETTEPEPETTEDAPEGTTETTGNLDDLQAQNELLRQQLNQALEIQQTQSQSKSEPEPEPEPELDLKPVGLKDDYLDGNDLDDVIDDPKLFNSVISNAVQHAVEITKQSMLRSIPEIVMKRVNEYGTTQQAVQNFYTENPDLQQYANVVGFKANELHANNPNWDTNKIFKEAAIETRKILGLKKQTKKLSESSDTKPKGLASKTKARKKPVQKINKLQKEIDDLFDY